MEMKKINNCATAGIVLDKAQNHTLFSDNCVFLATVFEKEVQIFSQF